MTLSEIFDHGDKVNFKYNSHTYNSLGIVLKETEEDEIKDFVLERLENLDNNMDKFKNTPEQPEFLENF